MTIYRFKASINYYMEKRSEFIFFAGSEEQAKEIATAHFYKEMPSDCKNPQINSIEIIK